MKRINYLIKQTEMFYTKFIKVLFQFIKYNFNSSRGFFLRSYQNAFFSIWDRGFLDMMLMCK